MLLSLINFVFVIAFFLFAYVNISHNKAWLWASLYLGASVFCGFAVFKKYFPNGYILTTSFYVAYAIVLFFDIEGVSNWINKREKPGIIKTMQATKPYIEKTREFFGLLITSCALLINYVAAFKLL